MESEMEKMFEEVREEFSKVRKLLENNEKHDMEKEPYKKKYEAIENLKIMETKILNAVGDVPEEKMSNWFLAVAMNYLYIGLLHTNTEDLKAGEEQITKCLQTIEGRETDPRAVIIALSALNELGIIWSRWGETSQAKVFLERAEKIYKDFKNIGEDPVCLVNYFTTQDDLGPQEVLENAHTLTLYYLAQVYTALKDNDKSVVYCHMTLSSQLCVKNAQKDLDHIDWALNAATLSQCFMEANCFSQARHHLAASSYILQKYEEILKKKDDDNEESEAHAAAWENFKHRSADIARCWAKYGILLLQLSKERLLEQIDDENDQPEKKDIPKPNVMDDLKFDTLEKEIEPIENQITDKYLLDFSDAKAVFANAQKWLEQAKEYYTLENHASDNVLIALDMANTYKHLLFFEEHDDRKAKMHKRRIDILEAIIKELNPQYYKSACRQIWIELGGTYSDILEIKLDRLHQTNEHPTPHALGKINRLAKSAVMNYKLFLDSLETRTSTTNMKQFSDDTTKEALLVYFHLGRLYNKMITPDKTMQLANLENSINAYKFVVNYCTQYPKAAEMIKEQLPLCRELVTLLPLRINRLKQEIRN